MYIDVALINDFTKTYGKKYDIESILEKCGVWLSTDDMKDEIDEPNATLEELFSDYYFIIKEDKILLCSPDILWEDIGEYLNKCNEIDNYYKKING